MRRLLPVLLLAVPALAWAAPDAASTPRQAACEYSRPSAETLLAPDAVLDPEPQQARAVLPVAAAPASTPRAASRPSAATGGGGGNEAEALAPRSRGTRWHSFLPGMFR
ncbi:MAG: hypothetical protein KA925_11265 [Pseudoxanthomonas sp.]|nr:hypothetical protein [Pseudoxanthomonas sp.]MBP7465744.1 hypothetical protein [Pseudoxanthomonas sp.]MBP8741716.1 hypothetical protein [Pseudoxanthomonas sp.]MBP8803501.1 hypothetical protein [Pseudoxanthomonas sp.]MBP8908498.1 hypothetical protein [Pseudoxanthomonas sp.]